MLSPKKLAARLLGRHGYTIDQTILIVAIIAILITLIIITIGWTLLSRTSGTKGAAYMSEISAASETFYSSDRRMPTSLAELVNRGLVRFRANADGSKFYHDIGGSTGEVALLQLQLTPTQRTNYLGIPTPGTSNETYTVQEFTNVPTSEAKELDRAQDNTEIGGNGGVSGTVIFRPSGQGCGNGTLDDGDPAAINGTTVTVCKIDKQI